MTIHPKDFPQELIDALAALPRLCKHVHLPLQSGSTRVLAEMNRHYTHEEYISLAQRLAAIPGMQLTTDVIVAYPGETEEDFSDTLRVMEAVKFSGAFTFIYSPREGTPAADRTDTIPREVAQRRFDRLLATIDPVRQGIQDAKLGQALPVMVDAAGRGYTDNYTLVHFSGGEDIAPGEVVNIRITEAKSFYLKGEIV
jgi:tRNA-2-methylthio-N6-dimethylallyladenosine synthase